MMLQQRIENALGHLGLVVARGLDVAAIREDVAAAREELRAAYGELNNGKNMGGGRHVETKA